MRNWLTILLALCFVAEADESREVQTKKYTIIGKQKDDSLAITKRGSVTSKIKWSDAVGQRIVAEGIAWTDSKGLGDRIILDGATVYVQLRQQFGKDRGMIVRVEGVLEKAYYDAVPSTSQGLGGDLYYFTIAGAKWTEIDRVRSPYLIVVDSLDP